MSADIEAIRARLARAARGPWDIATATDGTGDTGITTQIEDKTCVIAEVFSQVSGRGKDSWRCIHTAKFIAHAPTDIAALLAEVERLQRERSEWCDQADRRLTDYMTQQRDLLAENERLREALTLTPERVEAAAKAQYEFDNPGGPEFKDCMARCLYLGASRAALLAAGMEEEQ